MTWAEPDCQSPTNNSCIAEEISIVVIVKEPERANRKLCGRPRQCLSEVTRQTAITSRTQLVKTVMQRCNDGIGHKNVIMLGRVLFRHLQSVTGITRKVCINLLLCYMSNWNISMCFSSWLVNADTLTGWVLHHSPANWFSDATLQKHWRTFDFPFFL